MIQNQKVLNKYRKGASDATLSSSRTVSLFILSFNRLSVFTLKNNVFHSLKITRDRLTDRRNDGLLDRRTDGRTQCRRIKQGRIHGTRCALEANFLHSKITRDGRTDRRTDRTSYRDATAHLKMKKRKDHKRNRNFL